MLCIAAADIHVGNHRIGGGPREIGVNRRCQMALDALAEVIGAAARAKAPLILCGDIFDTPNPTPQMVAAVQRLFAEYPRIHAIPGNHDVVSDLPGDHALAALEPVCHVYDRPALVRLGDAFEALFVPYRRQHARQYIPAAVQSFPPVEPGVVRLLVFHAGVFEDEARLPPWQRAAMDALPASVLAALVAEGLITTYACGNWHEAKPFPLPNGNMGAQIGSLIPTSAGESDGWGRLTRIEGQRVLWLANPASDVGPRFVTEHLQDFDRWAPKLQADPRLILRVILPPGAKQYAAESLLAPLAKGLLGIDLVREGAEEPAAPEAALQESKPLGLQAQIDAAIWDAAQQVSKSPEQGRRVAEAALSLLKGAA